MNTMIPFDDFGGSGPLLHFAHPNAYTPRTFRQLLEPLTADFHVVGVHLRPLWPGRDPGELKDWEMIAADLQQFFAQRGYQGVIGVGHSLGAVASMMAAVRWPDLFQTLVLIEPVFLPPDILSAIAARPELGERMPLLSVTRRRRTHWPDRQSAFEHFRRKSVFERWSDEAVWDYVNFSLRDTSQGEAALAYSREWEAQFYAHPPLRVWQEIPQISQPTLAIRGGASDTLLPPAWRRWQDLQPQATFVEIPDAGHMVTMERPQLLASTIRDFLRP